MDVSEETKRLRREISNFIDRDLKFGGDPESVRELLVSSSRYLALASSYLWRPLLVLETAKAYRVCEERAMPYAVAVEYVHDMTLVKDDMPSMDDSDERRRQESCHVKFGLDIAGLTDLYFIAKTIRLSSGGSAKPEQRCKILERIGVTGERLAVGQVIDLKRVEKDIDGVLERDGMKTGSLFETAMHVGGVLGGASDWEMGILGNVGMKIGLAYQSRDDLYDRTSGTRYLGKPTGQDGEKVTLFELMEGDVERVETLIGWFEAGALEELRQIPKWDFSGVERIIGEMGEIHKP